MLRAQRKGSAIFAKGRSHEMESAPIISERQRAKGWVRPRYLHWLLVIFDCGKGCGRPGRWYSATGPWCCRWLQTRERGEIPVQERVGTMAQAASASLQSFRERGSHRCPLAVHGELEARKLNSNCQLGGWSRGTPHITSNHCVAVPLHERYFRDRDLYVSLWQVLDVHAFSISEK